MPSFKRAWKNRVDARFGSVPAHYIGVDDLIRAIVIASPQTDLASPLLKPVRDALEVGKTFLIAGADPDVRIIGLARTQFSQSYPELDWILLVEQPLAPIRQLKDRFLLLVGMVMLISVGVAVYFSWVLTRPIVEEDLHHLHLERL